MEPFPNLFKQARVIESLREPRVELILLQNGVQRIPLFFELKPPFLKEIHPIVDINFPAGGGSLPAQDFVFDFRDFFRGALLLARKLYL